MNEARTCSAFVWGNGRACGDAAASVSRPSELKTGGRQLHTLGVASEQVFVATSSGALWAAGWNGQHCLFEEQPEALQPIARVDLQELDGRCVEAVAGGKEHLVAIMDGGDVVLSWGSGNEFGQAAQGSTTLGRVKPRAVSIPGPRVQVRQVACGELHTLLLTVAGTVYAAGDGSNGALGQGNLTSSPNPIHVNGGDALAVPIRSIAAGANHSLALSVGGNVLAWGKNKHGRLGLGDDTRDVVSLPTLVDGLHEAQQIAGGGRHTAVLLSGGRCLLTGDNQDGQLGQSASEVPSTSHFTGIEGEWRAVSLGEFHTLLLRRTDGVIFACGRNDEGQLGVGSPASNGASDSHRGKVLREVPLPYTTHSVVGMAAGPAHSVALLMASGPSSSPDKTLKAALSATAPLSGNKGADSDSPLRRTETLRHAATRAVEHLNCLKPRQSTLDEGEEVMPRTLSGGCKSALSQEDLEASPALLSSLSATAPQQGPAKASARFSSITHPGVCVAAKFAGMSLSSMRELLAAGSDGFAELQKCLAAIFAVPALLNASFCFSGLRRLRVDADGLQGTFGLIWASASATPSFDITLRNAIRSGLKSWGGDGDIPLADTPPPLNHRDQVRGLAMLLHCPLLARSASSEKDYLLMVSLTSLIAALPRAGRRAFIDIVVEDMETTMRSVLVPCVRDFCDAAVRKLASNGFDHLGHVWSGLLVLDLLAFANQAVHFRLQAELPGELLTRTATLQSTVSLFRRSMSLGSEGRVPMPNPVSDVSAGMWAPEPPVPAAEFHLTSLSDNAFPPEAELALFERNAKGKMASPEEILLLRPQDERLHSFIVHRRLIPANFMRRVLQIENHFRQNQAQQRSMHEAIHAALAGRPNAIGPGGMISINPNEVFLILTVRRSHIVEDTLQRLQDEDAGNLRRQLKVIFQGEEGQDAGGVSREFFRLLGEKLFTPESKLFDRDVAEDARVLWLNAASDREAVDFWLVGVVLGLAVYNNLPGLDVRLPVCIFRKLCNEPLDLEDLREVRPAVAGSLKEVLAWQPPAGMNAKAAADLFESTFGLDFSITCEANSTRVVRELKEGGQSIPVTLDNRKEFVQLYCKWVLETSIKDQFEAFQKGFKRVCDSDVFKALTGFQLAQIVLGDPDINLEHLRPKARFEGFDPRSPYIEKFWEVLRSFDAKQRRRFLAFVTGSDRAPVGGLKELQLVIQRAGGDTDRLPSAHTCFNSLILPEYSSAERLRSAMLLAIENAEGFGLQ